jgi:hypothetical protein
VDHTLGKLDSHNTLRRQATSSMYQWGIHINHYEGRHQIRMSLLWHTISSTMPQEWPVIFRTAQILL